MGSSEGASHIDLEAWLDDLGTTSEKRFETSRRLMGYSEYLSEVLREPQVHLRDSAGWLTDMFEQFGQSEVQYPWGTEKRFDLFDQSFPGGGHPLVGQERVQNEFYRALKGFERDGRPTRMILLHGPNGSAKTTFVQCITHAMEYYSSLDEGARYRFNWIFPRENSNSSKLGFLEKRGSIPPTTTLAHVEDVDIEARLSCELKDHPLLVLPRSARESLFSKVDASSVPDLLARSGLCPKCKLIFDALMTSYRGDLNRVLSHVQVERYYVSRGYRRAAVTIGPQMSVDAGERQVTMDNSFSMLPRKLARLSLYEFVGDLVDGSGGLIEFGDLLKRPLETTKYLLSTLETGEVCTGQSILRIDAVMVGTTNEIHLAGFRQQAEYLSFLGRLDFVKVPYILNESVEGVIYEDQVVPKLSTHISPHALQIASAWGVLTRLARPKEDNYEEPLAQIASSLSVFEKLRLYSWGIVPERFTNEEATVLRSGLWDMRSEFDHEILYEGAMGASPREVKYVLDRAAQSAEDSCLTPMGVLREIASLADRGKDFPFLTLEAEEGGYNDQGAFIEGLASELLDLIEVEALEASGLVTPEGYEDLWRRYVHHATTWVKGEKLHNDVTGKSEKPDESLMKEIEAELDVDDADGFRQGLMRRIAAWAIDSGETNVDFVSLFYHHVVTLKKRRVERNYGALAEMIEKIIENPDPGAEHHLLEGMIQQHGYCHDCAFEALTSLLGGRLRNDTDTD